MTGPLGEPWITSDRLTCEHAGYLVSVNPTLLACRCTVCARCQQHTGNAHQGHLWSLCKVTGTLRTPHLCCPGDCELEAAG